MRRDCGAGAAVWAWSCATMIMGLLAVNARAEEALDLQVHADPGLAARAAALRELAPQIDREVAQLLGGVPARGAVAVHLVSGLERMREVARSQVPDWAAGLCISARGVIVLRADLAERPPFRTLVTVLRHEWVHLLLGQWSARPGRGMPLWFEEGVAERVGGGISVDADARLDLAAAGGRLFPLGQLEDSFPPDAAGAALAYAQSRSFVDYVLHEEGWPALRGVLTRLGVEDPSLSCVSPTDCLDRALAQETGTRLGPWEAYWKDQLVEQARPWFHLVLKDLGWTLMILAALIAFGSFFVVRKRRRAQIEALPEE